MQKHSGNPILTIREVSNILKIHLETAKKLTRRDEDCLPSFKVGREIRVRNSRLFEWMELQERKSGLADVSEFDAPKTFTGGSAMKAKVKNVGRNRWRSDFGGFYLEEKSGLRKWYVWWWDENRERKFERVHLVANYGEAKVALLHKLEEERVKAYTRKYFPEKAEELGYFEENSNGAVKLPQLLDAWYDNYAQVNLVNKGNAEAVLRYWKDSKLAKKKANDITKGDIKFHFSEELKGILNTSKCVKTEPQELDEKLRKAKQTQRNRGAVLRSIFNWAIEMDKYGVKTNPVNNGALPKLEKKDSEPFTRKQLDSLFQKAGETYPHMLEPMAYAIVTGGRIGELENLKWENVNLEEGWIRIVNPKEKKSKKIHIDPNCTLYCMFEEMKKKHDGRDERDFKDGHYGYVFTYWNPRYEKWGRTPIADHFLEIRRMAGIKDRTFHSFRHTAGSLAVSAGANTKAVQAIYGHSTAEMTNHYLHASKEDIAGALKTVENQIAIGKLLEDNGAKIPHPSLENELEEVANPEFYE